MGNIHLYGGGDRERDRRAQQWREVRIKRFTEHQRCVGEWINFADIAEWCSREDSSILPNEQKRVAAFETLQRDLLAGEFEENGRSQVLFLHPAVAKARMTRSSLIEAAEYNYDGKHGRSYAAHCWIRREMAERWFQNHRLSLPPWFTPCVPREVPDVSATIPPQPASTITSPPKVEARNENRVRKRGPRSAKLERVKEAMRADIRERRQTANSLHAMLEKELETTYGVSRDTARKARNAVLSELSNPE
jgi:hypothetical protein